MKNNNTEYQHIIKLANESSDTLKGGWLELEELQISYSMDGKPIAEYLTSIGFTVTSYKDIGRNGLVKTAEGIQISTNGFTSWIAK